MLLDSSVAIVLSLAAVLAFLLYALRQRGHNAFQYHTNSFEKRLLKSFLDSTDGVIISNLELNYCVSVNDAACKLMNCKHSDIEGSSMEKLSADWWIDKEKMAEATDSFLREGYFPEMETIYKRLPNTPIPVVTSGRSIKIAGYLHSIVTVRSNEIAVAAKEALIQSENRFQALLSLSPLGLFETNLKGEITYANERWCKIFGVELEEAIGRVWDDAILKEDKKLMNETSFLEKLGNNDVPDETGFEFRIRDIDDNVIWINCVVRLVEQNNGEPSHLIGGILDITERKQRELSLKLFSHAVDHTGSAVTIRKKDGTIEYVNNQFCELVGHTREEIMNTSSFSMQPWNRSLSRRFSR